MTLSGFDDSPKSPQQWRAYIARLERARDVALKTFRLSETRSRSDRMKAFSRYDLICEHIERATYELETVLKA